MIKHRRFLYATTAGGLLVAFVAVAAGIAGSSANEISPAFKSPDVRLADGEQHRQHRHDKHKHKRHHNDGHDDDDDDDDDEKRSDREPRMLDPASRAVPPANGLILQGSKPKVQVN